MPTTAHSPTIERPRVERVDSGGIGLHVEVLGSADPAAPAVLLANGLGGRLYAWEPLVARFAETHRIATWDYRGLFESDTPARRKDLSIRAHAGDALRILDALGIERAHLVGWSMGVQVILEAALERPDRVESLVLLNGTYGHAFQSGLQPLVRLPGVPRALHRVTELLEGRSSVVDAISAVATSGLHTAAVGRLLALLYGDPKLIDMYRTYVTDVFGPSFPNYMRLFQELDAHSVYHLLPDVEPRTLVVSGALDWLTPAQLSFTIARRIPGAEHLHLPLGSHFALLEHSERVLERVAALWGA